MDEAKKEFQMLEEMTEKEKMSKKEKEKESELERGGRSYYSEQRNVETREFNVNDTNLKFRVINYVKEKDGVYMPHTVK